MLSPSKGKAKEETQWSSGWWEYHPLLDQTQRPAAWSSSSTIFSAHPTQPLITARQFSSSKQFTVVSPPPILASPSSYEPPTVISVSPGGDWLFAYFPSGEIDGVACIWQRGPALDMWLVKEWWTLNRGGGVVAANWLGGPREWTIDDAGSPTRLPPRGPITPVSLFTLILVTETRWVSICYQRQYFPTLRTISCPLSEPASSGDGQPNASPPDSHKICTRAAIGLAYNESSILIATRSRTIPSNSRDNSLNSINLTLPLALDIPPEPEAATEWESWGEESSVELCEVRLDWEAMVLSTTPLPVLHGFDLGLSNLTFLQPPPHSAGSMESSPDAIYLAASYLDFGDYTSTPKSELVLHALSRSDAGTETRAWACKPAATRSFSDGVLTFMHPCGSTSSTFGLYVGLLDTSGPLPREKSLLKQIAIGSIRVFRISDLTDHERWEPGSIMSPANGVGRDLPLNSLLSPNNTLMLCNSAWSVGPSRMSIQMLPTLVKDAASVAVPPLSQKLATSLLSGTSTTDISHLLAALTVPLEEVGETLIHALILAENGQDKGTLTWRALGLALETYRLRARKAHSEAEREILNARWQTALETCSLASCNSAFEDCKDGDGFDLSAVWQLVGLSTWVVNFVEKLLKECILSLDLTGSSQGHDDLFDTSSTPQPSVLLHLAHPNSLKGLHAAVSSVTRFRNKVGALSASEENSQIAKNVLLDLIDCSGVDLNALEPVLGELLSDVQKFSAEDVRKGLMICEPTSSMGAHIRNAIEKMTSSAIVNRPRLFIKPFELMDGVSQIFDARKDKPKDIITKAALSGRSQEVVCLRCGGRSEVGMNTTHISPSWRAWERLWNKHCICAGAWVLQ
ncbi:hypothetical protein R3P38DRAFT_2970118 [Favolaschia claudopus]|uniref:Mediator complex subunit 16 C-terminal domain-containing protein n=1 Tax=Favolaschia claudopus TaxID=2862362 RepID=A0AAW0B3J8_9AGAR